MILSRKISKCVGESEVPCRTLTVVLEQSPVLHLNKSALLALLYRFSMACMMLASMLYFLIVAHMHGVQSRIFQWTIFSYF